MNTILLPILFAAATNQFKLPPGMLESLCFIESGHKVTAIHKDDGGEDSIGICQVKLSTAKFLGFKGTKKQLLNPQVNMHYAAAYLAYQRARYKGSITKAIIAYNIGNANNLTSTAYSSKVLNMWRSQNE
jgi:soluble lytic murein transglycosylase-like protein